MPSRHTDPLYLHFTYNSFSMWSCFDWPLELITFDTPFSWLHTCNQHLLCRFCLRLSLSRMATVIILSRLESHMLVFEWNESFRRACMAPVFPYDYADEIDGVHSCTDTLVFGLLRLFFLTMTNSWIFISITAQNN